VADYSVEEEQLEKLKSWWRENRNYVIAGVVLGLLAVFGWRGWETHTRTLAEEGSMHFENLHVAVQLGQYDQAAGVALDLREHYARTPYAALGSLVVARAALDAGQPETAVENLRWAMDNARSREIQALARLRLARVKFDQGDSEAALSLLERPPRQTFASAYAELRGDIHAAEGRTQQAREAYQVALDASERDRDNLGLLRMKLDAMGGPQE